MSKSAKNKIRLWFIIPFIIFIGLIIMLFQRLGKPTEVVTNTLLERPIPTFSLPLLADTNRLITNQDLPKQPFLLNVWGSWCITCKVEHPMLLKLHQQGINIVGVNYKDDIGDALSYLNQYGNPFSMSIQDESGSFALDLGLTGAPETFIIDKEGFIRQHIIGDINEINWQQRIAPCLQVLNDANPDQQKMLEACQ